jgi:hypothetical protein
MNSSEDRKRYFHDFKNGKTNIFAISGNLIIQTLPKFAFRKIDDDKIAVLAWMNRDEAEDWRQGNKLNNSAVVELTYSELTQYLNESSPVAQKNCTVEII